MPQTLQLSGEPDAVHMARRFVSAALPPGLVADREFDAELVATELTTNALKYGALSTPDGRVSVSWDQAPNADGAARLAIAWRETAGPPVVVPAQSGYGTSLIRDLIPHELGGTVDLVFAADGVCCNIDIPLDKAESR